MKILIVDDTKFTRNMTIKRLPEEIRNTATLLQAENGEEAVKLYKEFSPDIVFLDLTMPVMDGFEALTHIMDYDPQAKVYVITADVQSKSKEKVLAAGASGFEAKPISEVRLVKILSPFWSQKND